MACDSALDVSADSMGHDILRRVIKAHHYCISRDSNRSSVQDIGFVKLLFRTRIEQKMSESKGREMFISTVSLRPASLTSTYATIDNLCVLVLY